MTEHAHWEQLVAGHALAALEPDEEQSLLAHLDTCASCRRLADEQRTVAARLAELTDPEQPPAALWERISAGLATGVDPAATTPAPAPALPPAPPPARLRERRRWHDPRALLLAAASVAAVAVGAWVAVANLGGSAPAVSAQAACRTDPGCRLVQLTGRADRAVLLIRGDRLQLVPTGLRPIDAAHTYVLWQLPRDGAPAGVVAFRIDRAGEEPAAQAGLTRPLADTAAFAISREAGSVIPATPSTPVAVGAAG